MKWKKKVSEWPEIRADYHDYGCGDFLLLNVFLQTGNWAQLNIAFKGLEKNKEYDIFSRNSGLS